MEAQTYVVKKGGFIKSLFPWMDIGNILAKKKKAGHAQDLRDVNGIKEQEDRSPRDVGTRWPPPLLLAASERWIC